MLSLISNSENSLKAMKKNDNAEIIFNTESIKLVKKPAVTSKNSNSHSKAELTPKIQVQKRLSKGINNGNVSIDKKILIKETNQENDTNSPYFTTQNKIETRNAQPQRKEETSTIGVLSAHSD